MSSCLRASASPPLLLIRAVAERQLVVAASRAAWALGIRPGMTLTQARALYADVLHIDHEPRRDELALEALGRWMTRFTPAVAPVRDDGAAPALFLDVTGCEQLFGGIHFIVRRIHDSLVRMRLDVGVAAAPTPGAAWALAHGAGHDQPVIVGAGELESALAPLPAVALRIGDELARSLHHLGLSTVGQVMALPRDVLPARFGTTLSLRLDQALGRVAEPLILLDDVSPVAARMDFDGVVSSLEAIWAVFRELLGRAINQLERRGQGARRIEMEFVRDGMPPLKRSILLSRPSRDPVNLFNLFRCATDDLVSPQELKRTQRSRPGGRRPGGPVVAPTRVERLQSEGFIGMRLSVPLCELLADEQISLLGQEEYAGQVELDRLIERLRVRLGEGSVVRAELAESYVPEKAWKRQEEAAAKATKRRSDRATEGNRTVASPRTDDSLPSVAPSPIPSSTPRPLHLLPRPVELRVMVSPCDDREGRPVMFSNDGAMHPVAHCVGPERIAGRWWDGHDKTRDYFDVQDPDGRRFWVFRVEQTGKWYLHGTW